MEKIKDIDYYIDSLDSIDIPKYPGFDGFIKSIDLHNTIAGESACLENMPVKSNVSLGNYGLKDVGHIDFIDNNNSVLDDTGMIIYRKNHSLYYQYNSQSFEFASSDKVTQLMNSATQKASGYYGTFTPIIYSSSFNAPTTLGKDVYDNYSIQQGNFYKIANILFYQFYVRGNIKKSNLPTMDVITIRGFPEVAIGDNYNQWYYDTIPIADPDYNQMTIYISNNTNIGRLLGDERRIVQPALYPILTTDLGDNSGIFGTGFYFI